MSVLKDYHGRKREARRIVAAAREKLGRGMVDGSLVDLLADNTDWPLEVCTALAQVIRDDDYAEGVRSSAENMRRLTDAGW